MRVEASHLLFYPRHEIPLCYASGDDANLLLLPVAALLLAAGQLFSGGLPIPDSVPAFSGGYESSVSLIQAEPEAGFSFPGASKGQPGLRI